jgi:hypothetical protein
MPVASPPFDVRRVTSQRPVAMRMSTASLTLYYLRFRKNKYGSGGGGGDSNGGDNF